MTNTASGADMRRSERQSDQPMRILAFAHGCRPDRGSEDGAGWAWARALAHLGEVTVITREDNRQPIERALRTVPERDRLHFVYLPPPRWAPRWKPDARGKRAFYLLWQRRALAEARALQASIGFDLCWHLTWSNVWVGSVGCLLDMPFVHGPLGGGVAPPWRLVADLGPRGIAYEAARGLVRTVGRHANPLARTSWRRADLLLVSTEEMRRWLPAKQRPKTRVVPQAVVAGPLAAAHQASAPDRSGPPMALFVGRLLPFKGGSLVVRALARAPEWRVVVCGDGPDRRRMERLADRFGVRDRISFRGAVPRAEVLRLMASEADALLFPSMHDESPATVVEAVACGLPVVCLAHGGAPVLAGSTARAVDPSGGPETVAARLADALVELARQRGGPRESPAQHLRSLSLESRVAALAPEIGRLGLGTAARVTSR